MSFFCLKLPVTKSIKMTKSYHRINVRFFLKLTKMHPKSGTFITYIQVYHSPMKIIKLFKFQKSDPGILFRIWFLKFLRFWWKSLNFNNQILDSVENRWIFEIRSWILLKLVEIFQKSDPGMSWILLRNRWIFEIRSIRDSVEISKIRSMSCMNSWTSLKFQKIDPGIMLKIESDFLCCARFLNRIQDLIFQGPAHSLCVKTGSMAYGCFL